jgi:hypothetical protein
MSKRRVVVCDDERQNATRWIRQIERLLDRTGIDLVVEGMQGQQLFEGMETLETRRRAARAGSDANSSQCAFDHADILIVDYDLFGVDEKNYVTGENVAYLARCYSTCGLIVAVNQFGDNPFDLSLTGHVESYADLNIGGRQLTNPGLWREPFNGFRPWVWPLLPKAIEDFEARAREVNKAIKTPILQFLGFDDARTAALPRLALQFLEGDGRTAETTTFDQFVRGSSNGLRSKDEPRDAEDVARIAAARVGKWLERLVLSGQHILADAPHLAQRYPSLLYGSRKVVSAWNATTSFAGASKSGIRHSSIRRHAFKRKHWLSRPAWWAEDVARSESIAEVADPLKAKPADFVFCEDVSSYLPREGAREFVADVLSPYARRYVVNSESPASRKLAKAVADVEYRPRVRFSQ